tara:strand:- start:163 stop:609 length:447 start_codon:yes stop_codon:yes gene_type:complete
MTDTELETVKDELDALRERMGVLNRELSSMTKVANRLGAALTDVTPDDADEVLEIATAVASAFSIPLAQLFARNRSELVAYARFCAWAILRQRGYTLKRISDAFDRDHGAVHHGLKQVPNLPFKSKDIARRVKSLAATYNMGGINGLR